MKKVGRAGVPGRKRSDCHGELERSPSFFLFPGAKNLLDERGRFRPAQQDGDLSPDEGGHRVHDPPQGRQSTSEVPPGPGAGEAVTATVSDKQGQHPTSRRATLMRAIADEEIRLARLDTERVRLRSLRAEAASLGAEPQIRAPANRGGGGAKVVGRQGKGVPRSLPRAR
jgi:hypothetical protein